MTEQVKADPILWLNNLARDFPKAISFASGEPRYCLFAGRGVGSVHDALRSYRRYMLERQSCSSKAMSPWFQYGRTSGLINELIARQLALDAGIPCSPEQVVITSGCQEAIALCLSALCNEPSDVALFFNPTYPGAVGAAQAAKVALAAIANRGSNPADNIQYSIELLRHGGKNVRALYLIPSYDNPTGRLLSEAQRRTILSICEDNNIVVLEDDAYGMFGYEGDELAPMAAMDHAHCVVYLHSYSKLIAPALRVGAAVIPDSLFGDKASSVALRRRIVESKGRLTLNTSQLSQSIVGGVLFECSCSLKAIARQATMQYRNNRDVMLTSMETEFPQICESIQWNKPRGGFFLQVDLPCEFSESSALECAERYGVLVMPMSLFTLDNSHTTGARLSFSAVEPDQIRQGIKSLSEYFVEALERRLITIPSHS